MVKKVKKTKKISKSTIMKSEVLIGAMNQQGLVCAIIDTSLKDDTKNFDRVVAGLSLVEKTAQASLQNLADSLGVNIGGKLIFTLTKRS